MKLDEVVVVDAVERPVLGVVRGMIFELSLAKIGIGKAKISTVKVAARIRISNVLCQHNCRSMPVRLK